MKKLINDPEDVVADALRGIAAAHRDRVRVHYDLGLRRARRRARPARSVSSPAAAPATSRCTAALSAGACSTPPAPARFSLLRCPTRC